MSARKIHHLPPPIYPLPRHVAKRRTLRLMQIILLIDEELKDSLENRVRGYGLLDIREWCEHCILTIAEEGSPAMKIPDNPVKDAQASATYAALRDDPVAYAAAQASEAESRAAKSS